jgi:sirohydrochlorin ferrochelatase
VTTGYIVFAHGSSVETANEAVREMARRMAADGAYPVVEAAFLEFGEPPLLGGVERVLARGVERIVVIPYFLTLGLHMKRDLPRLIDEVHARYPDHAPILVTEPLDGHPALVQVLRDRAEAAC